ncbi:hypothetical protein N0V93_006305 [Gnomoniopsis smithogilvyi]|uniref:Ribosomal protein L1 n=1 Tax=Gnomoniopsis smithogilvyi TaxID=1191159 RepID=A0A9W8YP45_9PEZI|nr:hypothetical protein N0V93_006305 [Gnomoniopsis smithogilvyi]
MASMNQCLASLARLNLTTPTRPIIQSTVPRFLAPAATSHQARKYAANPQKDKKEKKKKRVYKNYRVDPLKRMQQFSLCDAIRYARAFEVGQSPYGVKYDLAIKLKTSKNGAVIKSRVRLPHSVRSDRRIGVICKEGSAVAIKAKAAGAVAVGEETMFDIIRSGAIAFTSVICDQASADKLAKQKDLGRILGPKGIMPSIRQKTITTNVLGLLQEMAGADNYRERDGVVRIAIGQLGFTPEMVAANVKAFVAKVKEDCQELESQTNKELHEVVLSTTHGPGFSLNGGFMPIEKGVTPAMLTGPM